MRFSKEELLFFNQVTKEPAPFRLFFKYPAQKKPERLQKQLLVSLQEKGVLDEQQKISPQGMLPLLIWEAYRGAAGHLILGGLCCSLLPEGQVALVGRVGEEYELMYTDGGTLFSILLQNCEFMKQAEEQGVSYTPETMAYEEWVKEVQSYGSRKLIVGEFREKQMQREMAYYWDDSTGYTYDLSRKRKCQIGPRQMRVRLMELLNVREGVAYLG